MITVWKRRSSAPSFSMYLRYSLRVEAPTHWSSPRASAGLSMFEASIAPSAAPAPTRVCNSSMNRITPVACDVSLTIALSRSSNWPRYLVPAITAAISSASTRCFFRLSGTSPRSMAWASPSTIAVLPTPGSPMSTGLFFLRRESTSIMRSISASRPMVGSSLPWLASCVRSRQKWSSAGVLDFRSPLVPVLAGSVTEAAVDVPPAGMSVPSSLSVTVRAPSRPIPASPRTLAARALVLSEEAEQQMFRAHVAVVEFLRLGHRVLEHFFRARRIGQLPDGRGALPRADVRFDKLIQLFEVGGQVGEHRRGDALAFPNQAEQDVFRAHVVVFEADGLFARHGEHFPNPVREVVVHSAPHVASTVVSRPCQVGCLTARGAKAGSRRGLPRLLERTARGTHPHPFHRAGGAPHAQGARSGRGSSCG